MYTQITMKQKYLSLIGKIAACILVSILSVALKSSAQIRPLYFYNDKQVVDKNKANSYAITGKLSGENLWVFKRFDLEDKLIETGTYKDEDLTIPHGTFIYYMDVGYFNSVRGMAFQNTVDRFKATVSNYIDGKLQGQRVSFYPDGKIMELETFKNDQLDGIYKSFNRKGELYSQGSYINGKKEGEWISNYGKKTYVYENDKLVSRK